MKQKGHDNKWLSCAGPDILRFITAWKNLNGRLNIDKVLIKSYIDGEVVSVCPFKL